jgi:hypothetical protein
MTSKPIKYTMNIMDSFSRAFNDTKSLKRQKKAVESDSDSAKEEERKLILKRQKKKRRLKTKKGIKTPSQFNVRHVVKKESVTPEDFPEITSVESEFNTTKNQELIEAEENFFSNRNQDSSNKDFSHVRPFDYPFLRYMIQQKPQESFDIYNLKDRTAMRSKIEAVSRKYETEFLREPKNNERQCLMGNKCEGLNISQAKDRVFILREFLLPSELSEYEKTGKYPNEVRLCVMCKRVEILRAFINIKADTMGIKHDSLLQDYRNLVNMKGEYRLQDCILSSRHVYEGIIDPVVLHIRSAYRLIEKNGLRYYDQWRMAKPVENQHFLVDMPSH